MPDTLSPIKRSGLVVHPKAVVEYGRTANLGNYESLRVALSLEVSAKSKKELQELCDSTYESCKEWVENKIKHETKSKRPERK